MCVLGDIPPKITETPCAVQWGSLQTPKKTDTMCGFSSGGHFKPTPKQGTTRRHPILPCPVASRMVWPGVQARPRRQCFTTCRELGGSSVEVYDLTAAVHAFFFLGGGGMVCL